MQVTITLTFEDVEVNTNEAEEILNAIYESSENIRIGFDADDCLVKFNAEGK